MKTDVILRAWLPTDADALSAMANNKNIFNNLRDSFPSPYALSDAVNWIAYASAQQPTENYAIVSNGELVGSIGYIPGNDIYCKSVEVGYFIGEEYWGKGLVEAHVFAENKNSMKVLEKNGFHLEGIKKNGAFKNDIFTDEYIWVKWLS